MSQLLTFIEEHKKDLAQIYTRERHATGLEGILSVIKKPEDKVDVSYIPFIDLPIELLKEVNELKKKSPSDSIIYFYICDDNIAQLIEIDLRDFSV